MRELDRLKLHRARSRLYRSQILQVNIRWKALAEIYTMHSFAPFTNLNFFVKIAEIFAEIAEIFAYFFIYIIIHTSLFSTSSLKF